MSESYIQINDICKSYKNLEVIKNVSMKVEKGDFLTILGPSGAGKTTLLKMIAGFESPNKGQIIVDGKDILSMPANKRNIGMLFQNYALFPHKTVFENVAFPLRVRKVPKDEIEVRVKEILKKVKLEGFEKRYPRQMSGGQQQRVALARAIVFNPPLLLLDEPMAALDKQLRKHMQIEVKALHDELGLTTISVTHDQEEALTMSTKVCVMRDGEVAQIASPKEIYEKPNSRFVASFIGETNIIPTIAIEDMDEDKNVNVKILGKIFNVKVEKDIEKGSEVDIAIRPERIHLLKDGETMDGLTVTGVVSKLIYIGDIIKVYIKTETEEEFFGKFFTDSAFEIEKGDKVTVGIEKEDVQVVD